MERSQSSPPFREQCRTLTAGLIVKHNVCLWSLRCQSSTLTNSLLLLNPRCVLLNGFVQREGARGRVWVLKKKDKCKNVSRSLSSLCQPLMTQSKDRQYFTGLKLSAGLPLSWNGWWCLCVSEKTELTNTETCEFVLFFPPHEERRHFCVCYLSRRMCPVLCRLSWWRSRCCS